MRPAPPRAVLAHGPPVTRRAVLGFGLAGAAAIGGLVGDEPPHHPPCSDGSHPPPVPARQADCLAGAFGVVVHLNFQRSVYRHTERVVDAVLDLGVRHVRSRLSGLPAAEAGFRAMAAGGVAIEGVCGAFGDPEPMDTILGRVAQTYDDPTGAFAAFEGINEPNNHGRPWVDETRQKTVDLHAARSRYGFDDVPIVGPSLARVNSGGAEGGDTAGQSQTLGDLTPWIDRGNIHVYPRGLVPSTDIDEFVGYQRAVCGDLPIVCTEGGFFTADNYRGGATATPEQAVGAYLPRQLLEHWTRGTERFFCYELLDDPDPTGADRESNFGMLAVAGTGATDVWTPKPHYTAMRNFLSILRDPGPTFSPATLRVALRNCEADVRAELLAKRDGSFLLCLWRDVTVHDPETGRADLPSPSRVGVSLAEAAVLRVYEPSTQSSPVRTAGPTTEIDLMLGGDVVVVAISRGRSRSSSQRA